MPASDRRQLQKKLAALRADLREIEKFAAEKHLEFSFLGMKYFLKDPNGSNRWAKRGIFISESEWQSSSFGCSDSGSHDLLSDWEDKNFPEDGDE